LEVVRVRERGEGDLGKIASGISPPLCPSARGQGEERGEGNASRGRGGRLGFCFWSVLQGRRKEERRKRGRIDGLADFCLNFERFKIWPKCWLWLDQRWLIMIEVNLPSLGIFEREELGFWRAPLF
jgi:hypothetical protein